MTTPLNGDQILIDVRTRRIEVLVDDQVLADRRAKMEASERPWEPAEHRERKVTTALRAYAKLATSADKRSSSPGGLTCHWASSPAGQQLNWLVIDVRANAISP